MKKIVLILVLILSSFDMGNASAANLSHKQMSDIYGQGYHNALLETVVEVNAKASTRLEENRNLLTQYYDDTKGYINQRIQDYGNVKNFGELLVEQASGAITLADGVLELLSSFFEEEGGEGTPVPETCKLFPQPHDNGAWGVSLPPVSSCGFDIVYVDSNGRKRTGGHSLVVNVYSSYSVYRINIYGTLYNSDRKSLMGLPTTIASLDSVLRTAFDGRAWIEFKGNQYLEEKVEPNFYKSAFNNYYNKPTSRQPIYIPQLKPKLSCPDGDKVVQIDGRGGFVYANGVPVDSSGCTVYWQKPNVTVDDDGKVLLTDPDTGETIDVGIKPPKDKIPVEDKGEGCDGVLCFLGAVTSMISDLISSILGLVGDLLEGLLRLFVPDNLDFLTEEFNRVTAALQQKIGITEDLKGAIKGLFVETGTNPLNDIVIDMPAMSEPVSFREFTFIETGVPILKRIIGAIFTLYTIFYVYRKIVGQGGIMEK